MNEKSGTAVREKQAEPGTGRAATGSVLAVMYHYIREHYTGSGIFGMTVAQFEAQIQWLKEHYEVMHPLAFLEWLEGRGPLPARGCVLTFDDGLADHYRHALPILRKYGLSAFFFLTTAPLETGQVATVHKVHLLRQAMGEAHFATVCRARLAAQGWMSEGERIPQAYKPVYRWDETPTAELKFLLSRVVPYPVLEAVVGGLFCEVLGSEREYTSMIYLSWEQACELQAAGMVIGGHSHAHRMYSRLQPDEQEADIAACLSALQRHLGRSVAAYAYPFGQMATFNAATKSVLQSRGITCAFTNERGTIDPEAESLALLRVDPKEVMLESFLLKSDG